MTTGVAASDRTAALAALVGDTPEIVVDIDVVRANVERAAAMTHAAGVSLRPHTKTHKLPQIARMQIDAGAVGIQVAKIGEAEVMVESGVDDVLVGYPIVGERKLERLVALARRARISVSLDSFEVAEGISRAVAREGVEIRVLVEIDTGLCRLGVPSGQPAVELAERVATLPGIRFAGVFTHEGHVYGAVGGAAVKERLTLEACAEVVRTADQIRARGLEVETVSVGSAGTFRFAVDAPGVTEVRPGTYVFNDRSQIAQGAAGDDDLAAFVVSTVVSRPVPERLVIDAGSKVLTSDRMLVANAPLSFGRVLGHGDWDVIRLSEEHGVIGVPPSADASVGDRLLVVPNHICPVINLASEVTIVEHGAVVDRWPVAARGKVQ